MKMNKPINYMELFCKALPTEPVGNIWTNGDEIFCRTSDSANTIAELLEYLAESEKLDYAYCISTGYYDPEDDKRDGYKNKYSGWYYVSIDSNQMSIKRAEI